MSMAITGIGSGYAPPEHIAEQNAARSIHAQKGEEQRKEEPIASREIEAAVKDMERITLAFNKKLRFSVNHETDEVVVKVIDPETDKVIKVLPPEELQRLHSKLKEMIGLLFDEIV